MKGMRNVVAHEYGFIDYRIVWRALKDVLPHDVAEIQRILGRIDVPGLQRGGVHLEWPRRR
jgi:uncharacterized protein with HEPN domain